MKYVIGFLLGIVLMSAGMLQGQDMVDKSGTVQGKYISQVRYDGGPILGIIYDDGTQEDLHVSISTYTRLKDGDRATFQRPVNNGWALLSFITGMSVIGLTLIAKLFGDIS